MNIINTSTYTIRTDMNDLLEADLVLIPDNDWATVKGICFDTEEGKPGCVVNFVVHRIQDKVPLVQLAHECHLIAQNVDLFSYSLSIPIKTTEDRDKLINFYKRLSNLAPEYYEMEIIDIRNYIENSIL